MPDPKGALSPEEFDTAVDWLNHKIKNSGHCAVCEGDQPLVLLDDIGNLLINARESYPVLVLVCPTCGFFRLHGAMRAGISKQQEKKNGDDQNGDKSE